MKKTIIFIALLTLLLCSCGQKVKDASDSSWYVPADEWQGQETVAYSSEYAEYVASHPQGSPDPVPNADDKQGGVDLTYIDFRTEERQYSVGAGSSIAFEITYSGASESYVVWNTYSQTLERWNGETWERLIDVNDFSIPTTTAYIEKTSIYAGNTAEGTFFLNDVISQLTPGKYRLVAYINYLPVYAEFDLVE